MEFDVAGRATKAKGKLHFFCGKMAAGKSTKAIQLAKECSAVLLSEDEWLGQIYPEEIEVFEDYIKYSRRLRGILKATSNSFWSWVYRWC